jgi:hypothetical protein
MPIEALAMQGFPTKDTVLVAALADLSDSDVLYGAGNAMSVPVVGSIFAEVFQKTRLCDVLSNPAVKLEHRVNGHYSAEPHVKTESFALGTPGLCSIKRFPGPPQNVIVIDDDMQNDLEPNQTSSLPRFPGCGCWLHLVHVSYQSGALKIVHVNDDCLLLGRDRSKVPSAGQLAAPRDNECISRVHALLSLSRPQGVPHIMDLGSVHGTSVRGRGQVPVNLAACDMEVASDTGGFQGMPLFHNDIIAFGAGPATPDREFAFLYRVALPA